MGRLTVLTQSFQGLVQDNQGPTMFVDFFGSPFVGGLELITRFRLQLIPGNRLVESAALLAMRSIPFCRQEILQRGEQERPKLTLAPNLFDGLEPNQLLEETLGEILGVMRAMSLAAHIGVERIP